MIGLPAVYATEPKRPLTDVGASDGPFESQPERSVRPGRPRYIRVRVIPCGPAAGTLAQSGRPERHFRTAVRPRRAVAFVEIVVRRQPVVRTETREDPGQVTPYCDDLVQYERDTPVIDLRSDCHRNFDAVSSGSPHGIHV